MKVIFLFYFFRFLDNLDQSRYPMNSSPHGICLIINNISFQSRALRPRDGALVDEQRLLTLFQHLDFDVYVKQDLTVDDIRSTAREFAAKDHSQFDAFVLFILSHGGSNDVIYGVNGGTISVSELMCFFKPAECPTLQNKPKLFFFQACRGPQRNYSLTASETVPSSSGTQMASVSALSCTTCPQEADFLLAFSAAPGYIATRDRVRGSLFVEVSCLE